ncbi:S41 family peptidase [Runella slithyformis]|uniref:Peptidase S41 n=1 Tax=Runella slithyformis (strain ATCC 29530 / DSM 19594 / LMG 11500 / NCIMB 11436 / LSU 4) TaxID=761193 RepID=A0A7U4E6W9_RUNSL|nr:S41 family peptidase [Runella slithyformis]AEI50051.1 peptidase S41 [Runella slithyformis DSM 19594]
MRFYVPASCICLCLLTACSTAFDPKQTYSVQQIRDDFTLMRRALLESHPGIYRYTSPDSIQWAFEKAEKQLTHPMTEREFRRTVNPVFSYIRCGHTDVYPSKQYTKYVKKNKPKEFPLSVFWANHQLRITQNRTKDSTLLIGSEITRIDGRPVRQIMQEMWDLIPSDGYNQTFKISVANTNFGSFYRYLYGNDSTFNVTVRDSLGKSRTVKLSFSAPPKVSKKNAPKPVSAPKPNTVPTTTPLPRVKPPKVDKRRSLSISSKDSTVAILDINTFSDRGHRKFYRRSFKKIKEKNIEHLVIDLRANGGGRSDASINLMSYLLDSNYVVYDTIDAVRGRPSFNAYYGGKLLRFAARNFWSRKISSDRIRNRSAAKVLRPNKKFGFKGKVYLLTNGGSFSAAAIFASIIQQYNPRAVSIGRETGGGQYGCNAFISPYVTLPNTKAKVRIPMFKIVLHLPGHDKGRGVMPDIPVEYTYRDVVKTKDLDMDKVYELTQSINPK